MGKESYARKLYKNFEAFYNLDSESPEIISRPGLIINLHMGVKFLLLKNVDPLKFFLARLEILRESVITGDEISSGVIPIDEFSRKWRDETGKLYQALAREADIVDRVFAGLTLRLKG
ncbi:MAG: bifunctional adenosylcobinamide kinase/adenosylcobinamide-phosphate guanylyltransferase [Synergistaceae bacterium]|nr:bifunctional adenosylcobinamide kinase/adenosylcobinamide-phosphate guanylyltransferase [Synergistaceae bacterium]